MLWGHGFFLSLSGQASDYLINDCHLVTESFRSADVGFREGAIVLMTFTFLLPAFIGGLLHPMSRNKLWTFQAAADN